MPLYWIETTSSHRMVYCVESDTKPDTNQLYARINDGTIIEVGQEWKGEMVDSVKEVTLEEYQTLFDQHNTPGWSNEEKLTQITKLNEEVTLDDEQA